MTDTYNFLKTCVNDIQQFGATSIGQFGLDHMITAMEAVHWHDVKKTLPEALDRYVCRRSIPCLVAVAPPRCRPNAKPYVTVARRQWNFGRCRYEWSRGLKVIKWKELPDV